MIVTCPACRTRYLVDERALGGPSGRTVRCANCGNTWHQRSKPEPVLSAAANPEPVRAEPPLEVPPRPVPAPAPPPGRRRGGGGAVWLVLIVVIAALIAAAILGRRQVVAHFPRTAPAYAFIGLPVERPGSGLAIRKILPTRSDGGLVIEGEIANTGSERRTVPRLRVALRNASDKEVQAKTIAPPKSRLEPGEVAHFRTVFERPNETATGVVVTFAAPGSPRARAHGVGASGSGETPGG
jgi:predicted Zn finger-like uncharacterized protein